MSMFNTGDILETIEMFTQDNLDVRTVTMGISLLDCIDPDPKKACENIYNKITTKAANLVPTVEHISAEYGIPIINKRISVTPIAMLLGACPAQSKPEAIAWAAQHLFELQLTARHALAELNIRAPVQVQLVNMYFATRRYGSGTLPAGRYDALRIDLGAGKGRNWWCVLYPGLCRSACGSYAQPAENDLVCGEYILRFKVVEWVQQRTARREDVVLVG